ncbi:YbjN domain-containing protein [Jiangella aurantiaca]|uniref:YbjN domain-containing protein n=1 Tax=Jiangella aurantiaca TaxID=2530373 RepID=UPI0013A5EEFE|nr:YbjN domain-containing protein [Jiangella aurantiaca]
MSQLDRLRADLSGGPRPATGRLPVPVTASGHLPARPAAATGATSHLHQLVRAALDAISADYEADGGDVIGVWENGIFDFGVLADDEGRAEVLQVHGLWERMMPPGGFQAAVVFANEWNAQHVWPKVFVLPDNEGWIGLHCEVTADLGADPTVDRVDLAINTGIVSGLAVFDAAELAFPDARRIAGAADLDESE